MADYYWKGGSGSNGWNTAANWVNSGGSAYGSPPSASDDVYFDDTGQTDCVLNNTNLTASYIYIQSNFSHLLTMSGLSAKVVMNGMQVSKAAVFSFTASTEFEIRSSGSGFSSYVNSSSTTSNNHYIRYLIDTSPFANDTSRLATTYDFNSKNYCLVDGVYPTIDRPGNLEAKAIFKDTSGGAFNSYGSVDLHNFTNTEFTSTSTNPDVFDYDKQFYFEGRYGSDHCFSYRIGENFKFGHTTVIFRAGTDNQGNHFQVPVKGDIVSSGSPRGNITTNVFNVQYHKVIIRAPPLLSQPRYCYIEDGRTLECNELVIEAGGRLYGPAEGEQVASSKIKSVKRPTVQGDWNFKQIADGIYESIDNIPTLPVTEGGTGLNTVPVNSLLIGQGQLPLTTLAMGSADEVLKVNSGGTALEFGAASGGGGVSLSGSTNDQLVTVTGPNAIQGESNLTLSSAGDLALSGTMTMTDTAADNTTPVLTVEQNRTDNNAMLAKFIGNGNEVLHVKNSGRLHWELSTSGGASDEVIMTYNDTAGNERNFMQIDQGTVVLNNRGPNGDVEIRANTSTAGSSGEVSVANFQDDRVILNTRTGIGIDAPVNMLHVFGNNSTTSQSSGGAASITIEQDGTGDAAINLLLTAVRRWIVGIDNSDGDKFKIQTGGTALDGTNHVPALTIADNGDTGINQTDPQALLHIKGSENSWDKHIRLEDHDTTSYAAIVYDDQGLKLRTFDASSSGSSAPTDRFYFRNSVNTSTFFVDNDGDVEIPIGSLTIGNSLPTTAGGVIIDSASVAGAGLANGAAATLFTVPTTRQAYDATIYFYDVTNGEYQVEKIIGHNTGIAVNYSTFGQVFSGSAAIGSLDAVNSSGTTLIQFTNNQGGSINYQAKISITHMEAS